MNRKRILLVFVVATFLIACVKQSSPGIEPETVYTEVGIWVDAEPYENGPYDNSKAKVRTP